MINKLPKCAKNVTNFAYTFYIHYRICQSCDYINGLVTLDCLPGLI